MSGRLDVQFLSVNHDKYVPFSPEKSKKDITPADPRKPLHPFDLSLISAQLPPNTGPAGTVQVNNGPGASSTANKNLSHVPCKFFRQGICQAGNSCPFSHNLEGTLGADKLPCKYFQKGNCKFGLKCALAHFLPDGTRVNSKSLSQYRRNGRENYRDRENRENKESYREYREREKDNRENYNYKDSYREARDGYFAQSNSYGSYGAANGSSSVNESTEADHSFAKSNGPVSNGLAHSATNGMTSNGMASNGMSSNGMASNGMSSNGMASNGMSSNGMASNGITTHGLTVNTSSGSYSNGNGIGSSFSNSLSTSIPAAFSTLSFYPTPVSQPIDISANSLPRSSYNSVSQASVRSSFQSNFALGSGYASQDWLVTPAKAAPLMRSLSSNSPPNFMASPSLELMPAYSPHTLYSTPYTKPFKLSPSSARDLAIIIDEDAYDDETAYFADFVPASLGNLILTPQERQRRDSRLQSGTLLVRPNIDRKDKLGDDVFLMD